MFKGNLGRKGRNSKNKASRAKKGQMENPTAPSGGPIGPSRDRAPSSVAIGRIPVKANDPVVSLTRRASRSLTRGQAGQAAA